MPRDECAQCLIFLVTNRTPWSAWNSNRCPAKSIVKRYALIPRFFIRRHPEVVELFSRNDVKVLTSAQDDSLLPAIMNLNYKDFESCEGMMRNLEMFEIQLMFRIFLREGRHLIMPNPLLVVVDPFNWDIAKLLFKKNIDVYLSNDKRTDFISVYNDHDLNLITRFIFHSSDVIHLRSGGGTILHFAVEKKVEHLVELLLEHGASVDAKRSDGMTPLHMAVKERLLGIVKALLKHGADIDARVQDTFYEGYTPLIFAYRRGFHDVVKILLESGADVNTQFFIYPEYAYRFPGLIEKLKTETNILYLVATEHRYEDMKLILRYQPDVNNEYNIKAFHYTLFECEDEFKGIFEDMKQCGFAIDRKRYQNLIKFLCGAVHKNCLEVVREIVEAGINVNGVYEVSAEKKLLPLQLAAKHAGEDVLQLLLDAGGDINAELEGKSIIFSAVENCNLSIVKYLVRNGAQFRKKAGLIRKAAGNGSLELVKYLLMNGFPLTFKDEYNMAVAEAAQAGHMSVIELLFEYGTHLTLDHVNYRLHLHYAMVGGHTEIFQAILDQNFANPMFFQDTEVFHDFIRSEWSWMSVQRKNPRSYNHCSDILGRHLVKLAAAGFGVFDEYVESFWHVNENIVDFWNRCGAEIEQMQNERVGNSETLFYELLLPISKTHTGYAKNVSIAQTMEAGDFCAAFPIYSSVLKRQYMKAYQRLNNANQGIKTCNSLFKENFRELPYELKMEVIDYLNNCDLLILKSILPTNTQSEKQEISN